MAPAAPIEEDMSQPILNIQPEGSQTESAVQVLASVAATSIPQVTAAMSSGGQSPEPHLVAVQVVSVVLV